VTEAAAVVAQVDAWRAALATLPDPTTPAASRTKALVDGALLGAAVTACALPARTSA
jgi:hypothetical protein